MFIKDLFKDKFIEVFLAALVEVVFHETGLMNLLEKLLYYPLKYNDSVPLYISIALYALVFFVMVIIIYLIKHDFRYKYITLYNGKEPKNWDDLDIAFHGHGSAAYDENGKEVTEKGRGSLKFQKNNGVLEIRRENIDGRYEVWLQGTDFLAKGKKPLIPKNASENVDRVFRVALEAKAVIGTHKLVLVFFSIDPPPVHRHDQKDYTIIENQELSISSNFIIPSDKDCYFRIDDQEISDSKGRIQLRNIIVEERVKNQSKNKIWKSFFVAMVALILIIIGLIAYNKSTPDSNGVTTSNLTTEFEIGGQIWTAKNLDVERYSNNDPIPEAKSPSEWKNLSASKVGCWAYYHGSKKNAGAYGRLYNWYAVSDARGLAPKGWHVATDKDWANLLGIVGQSEGGYKLKNSDGWGCDTCNGNNDTGFSGLPGGTYFDDPLAKGHCGYWWENFKGIDTIGYCWIVCDQWRGLYRNPKGKSAGFSVRCVKD